MSPIDAPRSPSQFRAPRQIVVSWKQKQARIGSIAIVFLAILGTTKCNATDPIDSNQLPSPNVLPINWLIDLDHPDYHHRTVAANRIREAGDQTRLSQREFDRLIDELASGLQHSSVDVRWQTTRLIGELLDRRLTRQVAHLRSTSFDARPLQLPLWEPFRDWRAMA